MRLALLPPPWCKDRRYGPVRVFSARHPISEVGIALAETRPIPAVQTRILISRKLPGGRQTGSVRAWNLISDVSFSVFFEQEPLMRELWKGV